MLRPGFASLLIELMAAGEDLWLVAVVAFVGCQVTYRTMPILADETP